MTYIADLAPCTYLRGPGLPALIAIGWLDGIHAYAKGEVSHERFVALFKLAMNPWQPFAAGGSHRCELCRHTGRAGAMMLGNETVQIGSSNLFIPAQDCLYAAPSMILHYIDAHEYAPPEAFLQAVEQCPPMRSMEYLRELVRLGVSV